MLRRVFLSQMNSFHKSFPLPLVEFDKPRQEFFQNGRILPNGLNMLINQESEFLPSDVKTSSCSCIENCFVKNDIFSHLHVKN